MPTILLLAVAAAIYPQLLAVVVVILTRPNPRALLLASYVASLFVSVGAGITIYAVFRSRGTIAGASSHRLSPATYVVVGVIALIIAIVVATRRGSGLIRWSLPFFRRQQRREPHGPAAAARIRSRAEVALKEGSLAFAGVVGALLAVPGPFDLLALGHLARSGYRSIVAAALIVAFALIKFLLIEVPIVSYAIDPVGTAGKVDRFSGWMQANKMTVIAVIVGVIGLGLIGKGLSSIG